MTGHKLYTLGLLVTIGLTQGCYLFDESNPFETDVAPCDPIGGLDIEAYLCEQVDQGVVFVSASGDDVNDGSRAKPVASLERAFELESLAVAIAGSPEFSGPIASSRAVSIVGGFAQDWTTDTTQRPTFTSSSTALILSGTPGEGQRVGLVNLDVDVQGCAAACVGIISSNLGLVLRDVTIIVGDGASGVEAEMVAQVAVDGGDGLAGGQNVRTDGGAAGELAGVSDAKGGTGGRGGSSGGSATAGMPSASGTPATSSGMRGEDGAKGEDGIAGTDATSGMWTAQGWVAGSSPTAGQDGQHGAGGSGGGGGASQGGQGGGGGGGGAGGQGGQGAQPGSSGTPSVALVILDGNSTILNSTLASGSGGDATAGAQGAEGGAGGSGGLGRTGSGGGGSGGDGGRGGKGGDGGPGGDGLPGASHTVICIRASFEQEDSTLEFNMGGAAARDTKSASDASETSGCQ